MLIKVFVFCTCTVPDGCSRGGVITDSSLLPITEVRLGASTGPRNVTVGPVKCYGKTDE